MNVKSERIEQMIQILNRNLLLIFSGQREGLAPIESYELKPVDAVIFGHDKFAYEMVHFVKSALENIVHDKSLSSVWERYFVAGLESLLVECAVVLDDIERDCFISRVYCWFTEKLGERRELPRQARKSAFEELKSSVRSMKSNALHTMKGLENFSPEKTADGNRVTNLAEVDKQGLPNSPVQPTADYFGAEDTKFPAVGTNTKKFPQHIRNAMPNILPTQMQENQISSFPKMPGAAENYGLLHHKPESLAEQNMNELWMARRRQEAFEWKTQQHLSLVMDRLALHKSRLESDALRRQESGILLKHRTNLELEADYDNGPNAMPQLSPTLRSPKSRRRHRLRHYTNSQKGGDGTTSDSDVGYGSSPNDPQNKIQVDNELLIVDTTLHVTKNGVEMAASVSKPSRIGVPKISSTKQTIPMKFKTHLPDSFFEIQNNYMQISDSDDDDIPERTNSFQPSATKKKSKKKASGNNSAKVQAYFKHEPPVVRERPQSAKLFREVAMNDPEFKIHYRHTNYRRMPLTEQQEEWLQARELERTTKSDTLAKTLATEFAASSANKKGGKEGEKKAKDEKKDKKSSSANAVVDEKPKPKYTSANQFMSVHFPNFEGEDDNLDTQGPMRTMQLVEVNRVVDCFQDFGLPIKESALKKALVVPQDRPEAICLEGLRDWQEGLMVNPNPKEYWRVFVEKGGKKKKKGKKKKN